MQNRPGSAHMRINNLLFDLDGTLTDSRLGIIRSIQHAVRALGREPLSEESLGWCVSTADAAKLRAASCHERRADYRSRLCPFSRALRINRIPRKPRLRRGCSDAGGGHAGPAPDRRNLEAHGHRRSEFLPSSSCVISSKAHMEANAMDASPTSARSLRTCCGPRDWNRKPPRSLAIAFTTSTADAPPGS